MKTSLMLECNQQLLSLLQSYGSAMLTKDERSEFESHSIECSSCQGVVSDPVGTDRVTQVLELRRRLG